VAVAGSWQHRTQKGLEDAIRAASGASARVLRQDIDAVYNADFK
jgi:hypothetical protein